MAFGIESIGIIQASLTDYRLAVVWRLLDQYSLNKSGFTFKSLF